ncbi:uncharacterized protein DUF5060 [Kribbella amoyensis]|uniref:Uncharacterized protein DUF5060 n=1 Tax=Kribbella amoyensis TaxID=996641 RepID=A0A561C0P0_9ACTN|nr:DUF4038 domain-containing protein [Kribbella amoyensis]TWD84650.1 uncharacterized protein DUF5060 [Kribbella amoyensis]
MAAVWAEIELELTSSVEVADPYTAVEVWADFADEAGGVLRRPAFWDGGRTWRVRFAAPTAGRWTWTSTSEPAIDGLTDNGELVVDEAADGDQRRGLWKLERGDRVMRHADGTPVVLVGDTAWALPWRATPEQVAVYAADRQAKGFNAVLLMSVQPDMGAVGPEDRTADQGFAVGFADLADGHLNRLNPKYFQELDELAGILVEHGLTPVWQPVFQGWGWKGLDAAGPVVPVDEYARYCRYLVARYGARPAIWLVGADGSGREPQVAAGGAEVHAWDCYAQPTGIHYRPHIRAEAHQDAEWLDFQWCQTGHGGEHVAERVADMARNSPHVAVANGEPTYERTGGPEIAAGWWQGHEAWSNLCAGGTMGVVYGAAGLWQWRLHADEPGHPDRFLADGVGWREALDFEGSKYVGLAGKILRDLPLADLEPDWTSLITPRALRAGRLRIVYQESARGIRIAAPDVPQHYTVVDPRTGATSTSVDREDATYILDKAEGPRVIIFHDNP